MIELASNVQGIRFLLPFEFHSWQLYALEISGALNILAV